MQQEDNVLPHLESFKGQAKNSKTQHSISPKTLQPIIKWAGGKEKELRYIIPNLPPDFDRYIEPFVGGGSVFTSLSANQYMVNDLSSELICLYKCLAKQDKAFLSYVREIDSSWTKASKFFANYNIVDDIYRPYREDKITANVLEDAVNNFCHMHETDICEIIPRGLKSSYRLLVNEMCKTLVRKMKRMKQLETSKRPLPDKDMKDNIETAIKGSLYMYYRHLYNDINATSVSVMHCALFYFIRNYCYSGMFRYNSDGAFNVPYGGITYNSKSMAKKIQYFSSHELADHFSKTTIFNLDFEDFLRLCEPTNNDFIFLDPPYDSEFSTYANNAFTRDDQKRLADYLLGECKAKWMLVIKNTDFIYSLYNRKGINIRSFDKQYTVSFMNRNDRNVTHLLITNY